MSWRRRRRDRVVTSRPGAAEFDAANGELPRSTYRVLEAFDVHTPDSPVYLERVQRGTGRGNRRTASTVYSLSPRRHALARSKAGSILRSWRFHVSVPRKMGFCVRRKQRKEVLFALSIAGRSGVGRGKRWRRNAQSSYRC